MKAKLQKLKHDQKVMLLRRGLDPKNYMLIKNTYATMYLLDLRYKKIKVIRKWN